MSARGLCTIGMIIPFQACENENVSESVYTFHPAYLDLHIAAVTNWPILTISEAQVLWPKPSYVWKAIANFKSADSLLCVLRAKPTYQKKSITAKRRT